MQKKTCSLLFWRQKTKQKKQNNKQQRAKKLSTTLFFVLPSVPAVHRYTGTARTGNRYAVIDD